MKFILTAAIALSLTASTAYAAPTELCPQGTSFKRECNTCRCDPKNGHTQCSLVKCAGETVDKCPKGTLFQRQGNTCRCDAKTGAVACTKKAYDPKRDDQVGLLRACYAAKH